MPPLRFIDEEEENFFVYNGLQVYLSEKKKRSRQGWRMTSLNAELQRKEGQHVFSSIH